MKRVQVTIHPEAVELPRTFEAVGEAEEAFVDVRVWNWNVIESRAAFLLQVSGDVERFIDLLEADESVDEYDRLQLSETESYCFVTGPGTPDAQSLWKGFKTGSLMTVPPAKWNADGTYTFTIIGRDDDVQAAIDAAPEGVHVEIDAVGGTKVTADSVLDRLAEGQREAVVRAVELGYYEIPRTATTEDVAQSLGCARSTAAEHLRKAESKLIQGLFSE
jgi:predicted DNA binding protein